jgi:hypothetical protein
MQWVAAGLLLASVMCAGSLMASSFYGGLGLGEAYLSNSDIQTNTGSESPSFDFCGDLSLGYQFESMFGVEAGWGFGPMRSFTFSSPGWSETLSMSTNQAFVMPLVRLGGGKGLFGSPAAYTVVGLKAGYAMLNGKSSGGSQSSNLDGSAPVIGLAARYETMIGSHFSVGLQAGYDYCKFTTFNANGTVAKNADGSNTDVDFSGPYVKLVLGGWLSMPRQRKMAAAAASDEEAAAPAVQPASSAARDIQRQGDALMKARRYPEAAQAYVKAEQLDPKNAGIWQALGNAYCFMGQKAYALSAYKTSLRLSGGKNPQLESFIKSLQGK